MHPVVESILDSTELLILIGVGVGVLISWGMPLIDFVKSFF